MPRKSPKALSLFLLTPALLITPALADPVVSGSYSLSETANPKKSLQKIWSNFLAGYQQARNTAKGFVNEMRLTASLANSMEQNLIAWESVAKRAEELRSTSAFDDLAGKMQP